MNTCGVNKVDEWNQLLPIQSSVHSSQYVEVPCYTSLPRDDQAALEFRMDKTDTALDPSSMVLQYSYVVTDDKGEPVKGPTMEEIEAYMKKLETDKSAKLDDKRPAVVNLIGYSMFSSVEVFISDQKINPGSSYYPWMCYVLNVLYQSPEAKKTSLQVAGWVPDTSALFDQIDGSLNDGFGTRQTWSGQEKQVVAKVMLDTVFPARVLPVQTEITLRFNRCDPSFCLMGKEGKYRIKVIAAKLFALKMRLTDQALQRHHELLSSGGVSYPMYSYDTRTMTMMKGAQNLDWVPFSGVMPDKIYIWQVKQDAYNGKLQNNPFNFDKFGLSKMQVLVNEQSMITSQPTTTDYSDDTMAYMNTIMNTTEACMDMFDYQGGYFISVVDLTRDHSAGCNYVSEPVTGNLRLLMDYKEPLKESIVVFCMAEFSAVLHLDQNRNPTWTS